MANPTNEKTNVRSRVDILHGEMVDALGRRPTDVEDAEIHERATKLVDAVEARVAGRETGPIPPELCFRRMRSDASRDAETTALAITVEQR